MRTLLDKVRQWRKGAQRSTLAMIGCALGLALVAVVAVWLKPHPLVTDGAFAVLGLSLAGLVLRRLELDYWTVGILVAGFALYLTYLGYTSFGERNFDPGAHLEYVEYIAEHHRLPPADHCFVCHHPPLFYVLAAVVFEGCRWSGVVKPVVGIQWLSLAVFIPFVVFGVLFVRRFTADRMAHRLAAALIVFWPYSVINSVRPHSDTLVAPLAVVGLYFITAWHQDRRERDLWLACVAAALAVLTKSSGYALVSVIAAVLALELWSASKRRALLWQVLPTFALIVIAASAYATWREPIEGGTLCHRALGMACNIAPRFFVTNEPANYLYFDVESYLTTPYLIAEWDGSGRQYFWNHLLKSSLFGTHNNIPDRETAYAFNTDVATLLNLLLLGMTAVLAVGFVAATKRGLRRYVVAALSIVSLVGFLMAFRIMVPAPHHTDFRHIHPVLVPMSLLYVTTLEWAKRTERRPLVLLGWGLAVPFVLLSVLYFVPKYDLLMRYTTREIHVDLAAYQTVAREGAPWSRRENLLMERNSIVHLAVGRRTIREIDASFDNNDRYELTLVSTDDTRRLVLGPSSRGGLARYQRELAPPAVGVTKIIIRPLEGDRIFAMGHFVVK